MSWSVSAVGKAPAVAAAIEKQFAAMSYPCPEPEESVKQSIRKIIAQLCASQTRPDAMAVKVQAAGSMYWFSGDQNQPKEISNTASLTFESIYGYVE